VAHYRKETEKCVMAEFQAECLDRLTSEEELVLSEVEKLMVKRGRNSNTPTVPKRLRYSTDSKQVYAKATALECLVGYLYLTNPARLREVMEMLGMTTSEKIKVKPETRLDDIKGVIPVSDRREPREREAERPPEITVKKNKKKSEPKGFGKS
jgi:23S rRNA maturation mini-RNase III